MTDTSFEYRKHYSNDGDVTTQGLRRAVMEIDDADLGDHHIVLHEVAHIITRSLYGMDVDAHGDEFSRIEDALLDIRALGGREYKRTDGSYKRVRSYE